jgi:hypothetical protein
MSDGVTSVDGVVLVDEVGVVAGVAFLDLVEVVFFFLVVMFAYFFFFVVVVPLF